MTDWLNNFDSTRDGAPAALTFINVLFAVDVAALLVLTDVVPRPLWGKLAAWAFLDAILIFALWRQYINSEMPLQHKLGTQGRAGLDDGLSYIIALGAAGVVVASKNSTPLTLMVLVMLTTVTLFKVFHMRFKLKQKFPGTNTAVKYLSQRLMSLVWIVLIALAVLIAACSGVVPDDWPVPIALIVLYLCFDRVIVLRKKYGGYREITLDEYEKDLRTR